MRPLLATCMSLVKTFPLIMPQIKHKDLLHWATLMTSATTLIVYDVKFYILVYML